jgi:hypothetical protein
MRAKQKRLAAQAIRKAALALSAGQYTQVTHAVRKALKSVRPQGRKKTIVTIAKTLGKDPTLMNALHENMKENNGKPSTSLMADWIGEPLLDWREDYDLADEDSPYEDLTYPVVKLLAPLVPKWKPTGSSSSPQIDYSEAGIAVAHIERNLSNLEKARSRDEEKDIAKLKSDVARLAKAVGLKVS